MAEHKIPQDVEAEDKILGPFSFRQFVYLIISFIGGAAMFFLGKIALPLALIPAPVFVFFAILALPLKKDQPMEAYLGAMFRFFLLPKTRIWKQDIYDNLVEITAPVAEDTPRTKDIKGQELSQRLSFLAELEDSQGWSALGANAPISGNFQEDVMISESSVTDIMDENSENSRLLEKNLENSQNEIKQKMRQEITTQNNTNISEDALTFAPSAATNTPDSANLAENSANENISPVTILDHNINMENAANNFTNGADFANTANATPSAEDEIAAAELLKKSAIERPEIGKNPHQHIIEPVANAAPENPENAANNIAQNQTLVFRENGAEEKSVENSTNSNLDLEQISAEDSENEAAESSPNQSENVKIEETENEPGEDGEMEIRLH